MMDNEREEFLRTTARPFAMAVCRLLELMAAERTQAPPGGPRPGLLCECRLQGEAYDVRFVCRSTGIRPFLAFMDKPWPHRVYLGRLKRNGEAHVFGEGVKVFFNYLYEEQVHEVFLADLEKAVVEWSLLRLRQSCKGRADASAGPGCKKTCSCGADAPDVTQ